MKLQWRGRRRNLRLAATDRAAAAREAAAIQLAVRENGWERVGGSRRGGQAANGLATPTGGSPIVGPRKYVSSLNPGFSRELFATVAVEGVAEHLPLGTESVHEAELRALDLEAELRREGWARLKLSHCWEATVAVFWQANPMACTYTTLLTAPARHGASPAAGKTTRGWRVLVLEPDGGVRRAMVRWLDHHPGIQQVDAFDRASAVRGVWRGWDLILANRDEPAPALRSLGGARGLTPVLLTHGVFPDSDAIFASFSGVSQGYVLRRVPPSDLLAPLVPAFPEGPPRTIGEVERQVRKYFQSLFEPAGTRPIGQTAGLTARELEILDLLSRGFADKEIAGELGISVWTVHSHLKRIFAKFGVRTRTEAVVRHLQK